MYKSQFGKMDPYGFVVHILCLIYQNIISAFVTAGLNAVGLQIVFKCLI